MVEVFNEVTTLLFLFTLHANNGVLFYSYEREIIGYVSIGVVGFYIVSHLLNIGWF